MAKLTLEELRKMRGEKQKAMEMRDSSIAFCFSSRNLRRSANVNFAMMCFPC